MFFEQFKFLCDRVGKTPTTVGKEIGISSSAVSMWKNGDRSPQTAQLQKVADYFGVTVDYLLTGEEKTPSGKGEGVTDDDVKMALFHGDQENIDDMWEEAKIAIDIIRERYRRKKQSENERAFSDSERK